MVRKAKNEDVDSIKQLGLLVNKKFNTLFNIDSLLNESISTIYVYEKDKKVIGFLHITKLYETIDIINIVVDPLFRRQGIASNLLDYLMSEIEENIELITLEVATKNEAAINLYKKFGFEIINKRNHYYKNDDAYLMGKKIEYEK